MTAREIAELLDKEATLASHEGFSVRVRIVNAREVFGRIDVLVEPVAGEGTAWVSADRVRIGGTA